MYKLVLLSIIITMYRYEKQLQAEEEAYQQARRRLYQEVQDEKERLASQSIRQRQEMDKLQRQLEDSHSSSADVMRREYEKAREEQERRHQVRQRSSRNISQGIGKCPIY